MLISQSDFKQFLTELGFGKSSEDSTDEVYYDDETFGDCWVYFAGSCEERADEYMFCYDANAPQIDIVDFIKKGMESKWEQEDLASGEAEMGDDW